MDRKIATIVGATAALVAAPAAAQARTAETPIVPVAANYAELLEPIPDATQQLKLADAQDARLQKVQFAFEFGTPRDHHHHHHHSSDWYRNNGYMWFGNRWVTRDYYDHHHHHHHHHHSHDHY